MTVALSLFFTLHFNLFIIFIKTISSSNYITVFRFIKYFYGVPDFGTHQKKNPETFLLSGFFSDSIVAYIRLEIHVTLRYPFLYRIVMVYAIDNNNTFVNLLSYNMLTFVILLFTQIKKLPFII